MRSLRCLLLLAGIVLISQAADVQSQPVPKKGRPPQPNPKKSVGIPLSLASALLDAIDDPNLVAELKLTDDQVKQLTPRRQEVWDEQFVMGMDKFAETMGGRWDDTNKLLKKVLNADQYKRAVQVAAQHVASLRGSGFQTVWTELLMSYPELVDAYQLTEAQRQQVAGGLMRDPNGVVYGSPSDLSITLVPKQMAAAKEFMGTPYTKVLAFKIDPRLIDMPKAPRIFSLLVAVDVRQEINLTPEQRAQLSELREKWSNLESIKQYSPKTMLEQKRQLAEESEKAISKILNQEQRFRLRQVSFQTSLRGREIDRLYTVESIVSELKLKAEQTAKIDEVWKWFREETAKACETLTTLDAVEKKIHELSKLRSDKAAAVLSAEQSAKLRDLFGEPFFGHYDARMINDRRPLPGNSPREAEQELSREASFGKYATELVQLSDNYSVQRELRLSREQIKKAGEAQAAIEQKFPVPDLLRARRGLAIPDETVEAYKKALDGRSNAIEAEINKLLTAEQAKRFHEVMLQILKHSSENTHMFRPRVVYHPIRYPGVAEAVKLTPEQRKRIIVDEPADEVLSRDQKIVILKMLGKTFDGAFNDMRDIAIIALPRPAGREPSQPPFVVLLNAGVNDLDGLLKLTPEQSKTIGKAIADYRSAVDARPIISRDTLAKAVAAVLTAEQEKRLAQIALQIHAAANLHHTLTAPEMVKKLELTEKQIDKLTDLKEDAQRVYTLLTAEKLTENQDLSLRVKDISMKMMFAEFTDPQKDVWKELTGDPWKDLQKRPPVQPKLPKRP